MQNTERYFFQASRPEESLQLKSDDWPNFFSSCLKSAVSFAHGNYFSTVTNLFAAFGAKPSFQKQLSGTEQAWVLIQRSTIRAISQTIRSYKESINLDINQFSECPESLRLAIDQDSFTLARDFLQEPAEAEFVISVCEALKTFLRDQGIDEKTLNAVGAKFYEEITIFVDAELRDNQGLYEILEGNYRQTFSDEAAERARRWQRYRNILINNVRQPVLEFHRPSVTAGESALSRKLDDVLVPLNEIFVWPVGAYTPIEAEHEDDKKDDIDEISVELNRLFQGDTNFDDAQKKYI